MTRPAARWFGRAASGCGGRSVADVEEQMESSEPQETAAGQVRGERMLVPLDEREVDANPFVQFERWLQEAVAAGAYEPTAMALATATPDGRPSVRMVLLKGVDDRGFAFYTNYDSQKGRELDANPRAALLFFWPELERQVRLSGAVERTSSEESETYFRSRPEGSRLGAWISKQSAVIPDRETLERDFAQIATTFAAGDIPLPPFWGGYRLVPEAIEFWQGRPSRLHDRLRYTRHADAAWRIERLAP